MVAFTSARGSATRWNPIACRICGQIFPHAIPLIYHFQIHEREGYTLSLRRNGKNVHENDGTTKENSYVSPNFPIKVMHQVMQELPIQQQFKANFAGSSLSRRPIFKSRQEQSHFPSRRNNHAIFRAKFPQSYFNDMEIDNVDLTKPYIKKLEKPFNFVDVEDDDDKSLDLELKL